MLSALICLYLVQRDEAIDVFVQKDLKELHAVWLNRRAKQIHAKTMEFAHRLLYEILVHFILKMKSMKISMISTHASARRTFMERVVKLSLLLIMCSSLQNQVFIIMSNSMDPLIILMR